MIVGASVILAIAGGAIYYYFSGGTFTDTTSVVNSSDSITGAAGEVARAYPPINSKTHMFAIERFNPKIANKLGIDDFH